MNNTSKEMEIHSTHRSASDSFSKTNRAAPSTGQWTMPTPPMKVITTASKVHVGLKACCRPRSAGPALASDWSGRAS